MKLTVASIECWACDLPLPQPINLGRFLVRQRSHLAVRVTTVDGLTADCVTQSRGSPLDTVVAEVVAPRVVGRDALEIRAIWSDLERELTALETAGAIGRAWSAVEICLQDLRSQAAGLPLWQFLGGARPQAAPVEIVEGYALVDETDEAFAERLIARAEQGYRQIKIEAGHYEDPAELVRRLAHFRRAAGDDCLLVLDFAWSWKRTKDHRAMLDVVRDLGIDWIEDPFPAGWTDSYREVRAETSLAVGCGDESSDPGELFRLIDAGAADLLRIDATAIGGIQQLHDLAAAATRRQMRVSHHEHGEVHEHCVFGFGFADHVELFPTDRPFDQVHRILERSTFDRVDKGWLAPPTEPGTGIRLANDAVARFARRHAKVVR